MEVIISDPNIRRICLSIDRSNGIEKQKDSTVKCLIPTPKKRHTGTQTKEAHLCRFAEDGLVVEVPAGQRMKKALKAMEESSVADSERRKNSGRERSSTGGEGCCRSCTPSRHCKRSRASA